MVAGRKSLIVNISDAKISADTSSQIVTYSLGSCIGLCMYDYSKQIGGMVHFQLPEAKMDAEMAATNPCKFADTGTDYLYKKLIALGAQSKKIKIAIAGGASMDTGPKGFDIGKRNTLAVRKALWKKGLFIDAEDVGANYFRNLYLSIDCGTVKIKTAEGEKNLLAPAMFSRKN